MNLDPPDGPTLLEKIGCVLALVGCGVVGIIVLFIVMLFVERFISRPLLEWLGV